MSVKPKTCPKSSLFLLLLLVFYRRWGSCCIPQVKAAALIPLFPNITRVRLTVVTCCKPEGLKCVWYKCHSLWLAFREGDPGSFLEFVLNHHTCSGYKYQKSTNSSTDQITEKEPHWQRRYGNKLTEDSSKRKISHLRDALSHQQPQELVGNCVNGRGARVCALLN